MIIGSNDKWIEIEKYIQRFISNQKPIISSYCYSDINYIIENNEELNEYIKLEANDSLYIVNNYAPTYHMSLDYMLTLSAVDITEKQANMLNKTRPVCTFHKLKKLEGRVEQLASCSFIRNNDYTTTDSNTDHGLNSKPKECNTNSEVAISPRSLSHSNEQNPPSYDDKYIHIKRTDVNQYFNYQKKLAVYSKSCELQPVINTISQLVLRQFLSGVSLDFDALEFTLSDLSLLDNDDANNQN